jgi:hypothetical protein
MDNIPHQTSTRQGFTYRPLAHDDSIRLLEIEVGTPDQVIKCHLNYTTLSQKPNYHALSYTWGPVSPTFNILIDGENFEIRENLHSALLRLRSTHSETVWDDAVCLNQDAVPERNHQVKNIARLYEKALSTFIWLGDSIEADKLALKFLETVEQADNDSVIKFAESFTFPLMQDSMLSVFSKSWFKRAWVLQEFAASQNVHFGCGAFRVKPSTIEALLEAIDRRRSQVEIEQEVKQSLCIP